MQNSSEDQFMRELSPGEGEAVGEVLLQTGHLLHHCHQLPIHLPLVLLLGITHSVALCGGVGGEEGGGGGVGGEEGGGVGGEEGGGVGGEEGGGVGGEEGVVWVVRRVWCGW